MKYSVLTSWHRVPVLAGLLMAVGAGCTSMASVHSPGTYVASKQPRTIWLTRTDHSIVRMNGPRMVGDTVVGSVNGQYTEVPMADVSGMKAIVTDEGKTIALAAVGGAATVAALVVVFSHGGSGSNSVGQGIIDSQISQRVPY